MRIYLGGNIMAILLTQQGGIFGPIAKLMGFIMNLIFEALNVIGILV